PAFCREVALSVAYSLAVLSVVAIIASMASLVNAHEDHDHGAAENAPPMLGLARLATQSESYELVAILDGERLTIYLDRYDDNSPVTDANITVSIEGEPVAAEPATDGTYVVASKLFGGRGFVELVFDIKAREGDDLLIGKLSLTNG